MTGLICSKTGNFAGGLFSETVTVAIKKEILAILPAPAASSDAPIWLTVGHTPVTQHRNLGK